MISTGPLSRTALSRVTLVGARGRVELVLPSREPLGVLLPEVLRLLEDDSFPRTSRHRLVAADGSALEADSTLESAGVSDGAMLRLVPVEESVSVPAAHADIDLRTWCWRPAARRVVAGAATVVWAVLAGLLARQGQADALSAVSGTSLAAASLAALAGALFGRAGHKGLATTLIATAGAVGVLGAWTLADAYGWPGAARLACVGGVLAGALLLLGLFSPVGRSGVVGAAAVAGCGICWEAALALQSGGGTAQESARAGALVAVASVVALGLLPRLSLHASGRVSTTAGPAGLRSAATRCPRRWPPPIANSLSPPASSRSRRPSPRCARCGLPRCGRCCSRSPSRSYWRCARGPFP